MNTTLTLNPTAFPGDTQPATTPRSTLEGRLPSGAATPIGSRAPANPWRTFAVVALFVLGLFLLVRVAMAVTDLHTALDSLTDDMKYLRADGRVKNF